MPRTEFRLARTLVLDPVLQFTQSDDREADAALAVRYQLAADGWGIGAQQVNPNRGVQQIHPSGSLFLVEKLFEASPLLRSLVAREPDVPRKSVERRKQSGPAVARLGQQQNSVPEALYI